MFSSPAFVPVDAIGINMRPPVRTSGIKEHGISVVVPVYQSATTLPILVGRLKPVLAALGSDFELVLVNDSSPDGSWDVMCELADQHSWIRPIDLARNFGQHNASLCGIRAARFETIVTMDDDLQHPPEEIPKLISALARPECDVVYGTPEHRPHGLIRNWVTSATRFVLQGVMGRKLARQVSSFRAFRAEVARAFDNYDAPFVSIDALLTWGTSRFASVRVPHRERQTGRSGYTPGKLITYAINVITGFSTVPLQIASIAGLAFSVLGVATLCYVLIGYLLPGKPVPGFAFLASIVSLFAGVQLFAMGIMGEYLARMYLRSMQMPQYVVRASTTASAMDGRRENDPAGDQGRLF
jgi:glycosyltransferase involved in cell wall biosynthesis